MQKPDSKIKNDIVEIDLLDYVAVVVRRRWVIIRNAFIAALLGIALSFVLAKKYTATTTILPPAEDSGPNFQSLLPDVSLPMLSLKGAHSTADLFVEILRSRSVCEGVLNRNYVQNGDSVSLFDVFGTNSIEGAGSALFRATRIAASKQGIISVSVEMPTAIMAAGVANAYVAELDRVNKEKSTSRAKNSRIYIENQLRTTERQLAEASQALAEFQQKHKAISLENQLKVWIEQAGELKGQILSTEVELGVALQTMKPDNPAVVRKQRQLDEMRRRYSELQYGADTSAVQQQEFYIPFAEVPEVGLQLAEMLREVKVQETVWQLLNQQYYQAKIQEARDTPTVQVLDEAVPPEKRSKPKRKVLVVVLGLLGGLLSVFWVFGEEYFKRLNERPGEQKKMARIIGELRGDVGRLKRVLHLKR